MKIELKKVTIGQLVDGFVNRNEGGVVGFGGALNIRPLYQREFIYEPPQRDKVIDTVLKGFPLNVMYWVKTDTRLVPSQGDAPAILVAGEAYEVLDGQQRAMSICLFATNKFSIEKPVMGGGEPDLVAWPTLTDDQREKFLSYELMVYFCEGADSEKLDWFRTINIAGKPLFEQELRNAIYTGPWLTDAKRYFSRTGCPATQIGSDYLRGEAIRQDYLQTALEWASAGAIQTYMKDHRDEPDARELWEHFKKVLAWVKTIFPDYSSEMKGLDWGGLYRKHGQDKFDKAALERIKAKVLELRADEDVTRNAGIYAYVLAADEEGRKTAERVLSVRAFPPSVKQAAHAAQGGKCAVPTCGKTASIKDMEADHVTPWHLGGRTVLGNCKMLCKACNRAKGGV